MIPCFPDLNSTIDGSIHGSRRQSPLPFHLAQEVEINRCLVYHPMKSKNRELEFEENVLNRTFPRFHAEASHASASHRSSHAFGLVVPQARDPRTADECCSGYLPPIYPALNFNRVQYVTASSVNVDSLNRAQCVVSNGFSKRFFSWLWDCWNHNLFDLSPFILLSRKETQTMSSCSLLWEAWDLSSSKAAGLFCTLGRILEETIIYSNTHIDTLTVASSWLKNGDS